MLSVGIIGGSIAGCALALQLLQSGHDVQVFEKSRELVDRGVGILLPEALVTDLESGGLVESLPTLPKTRRKFYQPSDDATGRQFWSQEFAGHGTSWQDLYRRLRERVPDDHYHAGVTVIGIRTTPLGPSLVFENDSKRQFDVVVCADGGHSGCRDWLSPKEKPEYTGYVAWRGITPLKPGTPEEEMLQETLPYVPFDNGHMLAYSVPSETGHVINWLIYEQREWRKDDFVHNPHAPTSKARIKKHLQDLVPKVLPKLLGDIVLRTETPFVQEVHERQPRTLIAQDRIAFIGDAAILIRPHVAAGTAKALQDAMTLGKALVKVSLDTAAKALRTWNASNYPDSIGLFNLARSVGQAMVISPPQWRHMTPSQVEAWWQHVVKDQTAWYATTGQ